jgi:GDP-L-fucose synthase
MVSAATGFMGSTEWDTSKPDGTPRKLLDVSTLRNSGWQPTISLRGGIEETVSWYRSNQTALRV